MCKSDAKVAFLYDGVGKAYLNLEVVRQHLGHWLPWLPCEIRADLLARRVNKETKPMLNMELLVQRLCGTRVLNHDREVDRLRQMLKPELDAERRLLVGRSRPADGIIYDGNELQRIAYGLIAPIERHLANIHIWFTDRLFATWEETDRRYHARVILCGQPSIISTTGMVHAPARQRTYYLARRLGLAHDGNMECSDENFLGNEDPRATEAAKGYAMQAVSWAITGEPFCDDSHCRLYNAHWQREMLTAQLGGVDYCPRHRALFARWPSPSGDLKHMRRLTRGEDR